MEIVNTLTRIYNIGKLKIKEHSPEILVAVGIAGTIVATVQACRQTLKINSILDDKDENVDKVHKCLEDKHVDYSEADASKDLTIIYAQTGLKIVKLYLPAIVLGSLSIASIISGQIILKRRNAALAAAYMVVDKSFKKYRSNVVERFGEEVDHELRYNIKAKELEVTDEKGKKKKEVLDIIDGTNEDLSYSDYARFFDAGSSNFSKDAEFNLMYLRRQQDYANEKLKHQGHLFLNEVYDMLDIPRSKAGQVVGWIYDPKNNENGDNYVDFGLYKNNSAHRRFVNGMEYNILLDFNVDGVIYDLI